MKKLFIYFVAFYIVNVIAAEQQQTVPDNFQGKWSDDLKHCTTDSSPSSLIIGANHIQFTESKGSIKAIVTQGNEIALISELSGEGETWLAYHHFRLSDDYQSLSDITDEDLNPKSVLKRYKCPKNAKQINQSR